MLDFNEYGENPHLARLSLESLGALAPIPVTPL
jgi:hypothetical protein